MRKKSGKTAALCVSVLFALAAGMTGCSADVEEMIVDTGGDTLTIGIISDTQLTENYDKYAQNLEKSLEYIKARATDVLIFAGDYGDLGTQATADRFKSVYDGVFGDDKPISLAVMGNHDYWLANFFDCWEIPFKSKMRGRLEGIFGDDYTTVKVINGYTFFHNFPVPCRIYGHVHDTPRTQGKLTLYTYDLSLFSCCRAKKRCRRRGQSRPISFKDNGFCVVLCVATRSRDRKTKERSAFRAIATAVAKNTHSGYNESDGERRERAVPLKINVRIGGKNEREKIRKDLFAGQHGRRSDHCGYAYGRKLSLPFFGICGGTVSAVGRKRRPCRDSARGDGTYGNGIKRDGVSRKRTFRAAGGMPMFCRRRLFGATPICKCRQNFAFCKFIKMNDNIL